MTCIGVSLKRRWILPVKADTVEQVSKTWVAADGIEVGMHFEERHNAGLFLVGALQPDKCLLVIPEPQIGIDKSPSRNVACLALRSFSSASSRSASGSPAGMGVGPHQHTNHCGAAIGKSEGLFEFNNRLLGLSFRNQGIAHKPMGHRIVRLHG